MNQLTIFPSIVPGVRVRHKFSGDTMTVKKVYDDCVAVCEKDTPAFYVDFGRTPVYRQICKVQNLELIS